MERHEQLIEIAYIAAKTKRLKLVTSVMVVPHRPAVLTAKMLATIDVLSGGRLVVGIGAGWMREEFEAIGAPDFDQRGKVTDEYLKAFIELWTNDKPKFSGDWVEFDNIVLSPKPVQKPHPPIWVGGESGPALRRTARIGDVWYPIGTNPANPLDSLPRFKAQVARLRKMTQEAGRDPKAVGITLRVTQFGEGTPANAGDGERRLFSGKPAELAADIKALREAGVGHLDFGFGGDSVEAILGAMQKFRKDVLPLV
jgi:probable F420-dependent oxidoreductase